MASTTKTQKTYLQKTLQYLAHADASSSFRSTQAVAHPSGHGRWSGLVRRATVRLSLRRGVPYRGLEGREQILTARLEGRGEGRMAMSLEVSVIAGGPPLQKLRAFQRLHQALWIFFCVLELVCLLRRHPHRLPSLHFHFAIIFAGGVCPSCVFFCAPFSPLGSGPLP